MLRNILSGVLLVLLVVAVPCGANAGVLEQPSVDQNINFVQVEEGVFEAMTPDGSVHRRYVGFVGLEKRVAALERGLASIKTQ